MQERLAIGQWLPVISYKHDGSLHRTWDKVLILDINDQYIVAGNDRPFVTESDGRVWTSKEPTIFYFYTHDFYNIICMSRSTGVHYYCNVASPSLVLDGAILYIDYDLDVGHSPLVGLRLLDEVEYDLHRHSMHYSDELDCQLRLAQSHLIQTQSQGQFPFDEEAVHRYIFQYYQLRKVKRP